MSYQPRHVLRLPDDLAAGDTENLVNHLGWLPAKVLAKLPLEEICECRQHLILKLVFVPDAFDQLVVHVVVDAQGIGQEPLERRRQPINAEHRICVRAHRRTQSVPINREGLHQGLRWIDDVILEPLHLLREVEVCRSGPELRRNRVGNGPVLDGQLVQVSLELVADLDVKELLDGASNCGSEGLGPISSASFTAHSSNASRFSSM